MLFNAWLVAIAIPWLTVAAIYFGCRWYARTREQFRRDTLELDREQAL